MIIFLKMESHNSAKSPMRSPENMFARVPGGDVFLEKCQNHNETISLVQTDKNTVIGFYCSEKLEDTTNMRDSRGYKGYKNIL